MMPGTQEMIDRSFFDEERKLLLKWIAKYFGVRKANRDHKHEVWINIDHSEYRPYFRQLMLEWHVTTDMIRRMNRAMAGLVYSSDLIDRVLGKEHDRWPVFVCDPYFTGTAYVPIVCVDNKIQFRSIDLEPFIAEYGTNPADSLILGSAWRKISRK